MQTFHSLCSRSSGPQVQELVGRRASLEARINDHHDTVTTKLPLELVTCVFVHCLPADSHLLHSTRDSFNPLILGLVCRTWRRIAWATPQLWTRIYVQLRFHYPSYHLEGVKEWLTRSGQLPLSVHISGQNIDSCHLDPVIDLINQHSPRWRDLYLSVFPTAMSHIMGDGTGVFNLKNLRISIIVPTPSFFGLLTPKFLLTAGFPSPSRVQVAGIPFKSLFINWKNVTHVELDFHNLPVAQCLQLFQRAPQMVFCQIASVASGNQQDIHPDPPIVHHHLQYLDVKLRLNDDTISPDIFFRYLSLPSLKSFTYRNGSQPDALRSLLVRSGCLLTALSLDDIGITQRQLVQLLRAPPFLTLETLVLAGVTAPNNILNLLCDEPSTEQIKNYDMNGPFLPQLQALSLDIYGERHFTWAAILELFQTTSTAHLRVDGLKSNRRPLRLLNVVVDDGPPARIDEMVFRELLDIRDGGVDISIMVRERGQDILEEFRKALLGRQ